MAGLKDMIALTNCLKSVNFHIQEDSNPKPAISKCKVSYARESIISELDEQKVDKY